MYYTRPNLTPLELDLMSINGISHGARFWGRTRDDRPLYIKYDNGCFSVERGDVGADDNAPMESLLEVYIGPNLHSSMLLEQACDLAGLTVRGERVPLSEERRLAAAEREPIWDWSGRTTYWARELQMTKAGGLKFAETILRNFPDSQLLAWTPDFRHRVLQRRYTLAGCEHGVVLGFGSDRLREGALLSSRDVQSADLANAFAHVVGFGFQPSDFRSRIKYPFSETDEAGIQIQGDFKLDGWLNTCFATADPHGKAFVERIVAVADDCGLMPKYGIPTL